MKVENTILLTQINMIKVQITDSLCRFESSLNFTRCSAPKPFDCIVWNRMISIWSVFESVFLFFNKKEYLYILRNNQNLKNDNST
jgi:hypothetical protein